MNTSVRLFRKRYIPEECVELKKDRILFADKECLVTSWNVLKSRSDFASGISLFLFDKKWKITRVAKADGSLYHWYCDIMDVHITKDTENDCTTYLMEDLLIDIVIEADDSVHVLDLDEAAEAFTKGLITGDTLTLALHAADALLRDIRSGAFSDYQSLVESYVK